MKDEDKIKGSVKVIIRSAKIYCVIFQDLFLKTKGSCFFLIKKGKVFVCTVGR